MTALSSSFQIFNLSETIGVVPAAGYCRDAGSYRRGAQLNPSPLGLPRLADCSLEEMGQFLISPWQALSLPEPRKFERRGGAEGHRQDSQKE